MKKIISIIITLIYLLALCSPVSALDAAVNIVEKQVTVTGSATAANEVVSMLVYRKAVPVTEENFSTAVVRLDMKKLSGTSDFTFTFKLPDNSVDGEYIVDLGEAVNGNNISLSFTYVTDMTKFIGRLSAAKSWQELKVLILGETGHLLPYPASDYNSVKNIDKVFIKMFSNSDPYDDADEVMRRLNAAASAVKQEENVPSPPPASSGGGGYIAISPPQPIITPEPADNDPIPVEEPSAFIDISKDFWAFNEIMDLQKKGIIKGYDDKSFRPSNEVTREEFIKIIVCAFGFLDDAAQSQFTDVDKSHWAYRYVSSAYTSNISNGTGNNLFGAGQAVRRQDGVVFLAKTLEKSGKKLEASSGYIPFTDDKLIDEYASKYVKALKIAKVIKGDTNNAFNPKDTLTRAEAAKMIWGALNLK